MFPVTRNAASAASAHAMKSSSFGSGEAPGAGGGSNSKPFACNRPINPSISSGATLNLGRATTPLYSSVIFRERHGVILPYCTACKTRDSLPNGEISADTITFVSSTTRITFGNLLFPPECADFTVDLLHRQLIQTPLFGSCPSLPQPLRRGLNAFQIIVHAENNHCGLSAAINNKPLIVPDSAIHQLPELCTRDVCIDSTAHRLLQSINALIISSQQIQIQQRPNCYIHRHVETC